MAEGEGVVKGSKGSCAEVRSQLYVAYDVAYINENQFHDMKFRAEEISKILSGPRKHVQQQKVAR